MSRLHRIWDGGKTVAKRAKLGEREGITFSIVCISSQSQEFCELMYAEECRQHSPPSVSRCRVMQYKQLLEKT